ncbi:hypothetical protein B9Z19DRAFT_1069457 [Tuber borchii]|uniref:Uncharacterized protein n=1 Tax=Tuber borchii TaxID=42251 RepID=A0A2T6ZBG5_TUBBO|nr:hypothetical protein B9Z19DRAFT_1069457 [Tuber borchii]
MNAINNIFIRAAVLGNGEPDIIPLPRLRPAATIPVDHCFFDMKGFPQSSLDKYSNLQPSLFSHPYLYSFSWCHKVIRFFYMIDFEKTGMHSLVIGQMYWLGVKISEHKSENVELQRKEMVSRFLNWDKAEYEGILAAVGAGIYIRATVHSMKMMCSGSMSCSVIMGLVHCEIMDSDSDSEIEVYPVNS